jgi:hypothetical protein
MRLRGTLRLDETLAEQLAHCPKQFGNSIHVVPSAGMLIVSESDRPTIFAEERVQRVHKKLFLCNYFCEIISGR